MKEQRILKFNNTRQAEHFCKIIFALYGTFDIIASPTEDKYAEEINDINFPKSSVNLYVPHIEDREIGKIYYTFLACITFK